MFTLQQNRQLILNSPIVCHHWKHLTNLSGKVWPSALVPKHTLLPQTLFGVFQHFSPEFFPSVCLQILSLHILRLVLVSLKLKATHWRWGISLFHSQETSAERNSCLLSLSPQVVENRAEVCFSTDTNCTYTHSHTFYLVFIHNLEDNTVSFLSKHFCHLDKIIFLFAFSF